MIGAGILLAQLVVAAPGPRAPLADWSREPARVTTDARLEGLLAAVRDGRASKPMLRELSRIWQLRYPFAEDPPGDLRLRAAKMSSRTQASLTVPWQLTGPTNVGGRTSAVAFVPGRADQALVGAAGGGVWRWQRVGNGSQWTPLFDRQATLSIGSIAFDPGNPATVYVGTGEMNFSLDEFDGIGVLRSSDGGETWSAPVAIAGAGRIGALVVRPDQTSTLFAATSAGLFRSQDSGQSFQLVLGGGAATSVVLDPGNPATVLVGLQGDGAQPSGIWRSLNGGDGGTFVAMSGAGNCALGVLPGGMRIAVAAAASTPGTFFAALARGTGEVWRSEDGGATWCPRPAPANLCGSQCWYDLAIAVDPIDARHLLLGGIGLWRSTDAAASWQALGPVHVDHHALVFEPGGARVALDGNDGGLARITFSGASASIADVSAGYVSSQYYGIGADPLDGARVYGGTQDNGSHRMIEPATTAAKLAAGACGDGGHVRAHATLPGRLFWSVCPVDGRLHVMGSDDRGVSQSEVVTGIAVDESSDWAPPLEWSGASTLLTATSDRVWRSTNAGAPLGDVAWSSLGTLDLTPAGGSITTVVGDASDGRVVWAGTSHGQVWVTRDGGASWSERWQTSGGRPRWVGRVAVVAGSPGSVWLALGGWRTPDSGGHVFFTSDSGLTWSDRSGDLPDLPVTALALDPADPQHVWAGTWSGLYETVNNGASWSQVSDLPLAAVTDIDYDTASSTIRAATHGRGLWKAPVARCWVPAIQVTGSRCSSPSVVLGASSGFSAHAWSTGATTSAIEVRPAQTSVYCLETRDATGCVGSARATVGVAAFEDVPCGNPFQESVARLESSRVTAGCSLVPPRFCPDQPVTRAQMAVFLLKAMAVTPPPISVPCFSDVAPGDPFAPWICELARRGVTGGCATAPARYCPSAPVSRAQMAVFLLRALGVFPPDPSAACFADVTPADAFAAWICELGARGITGGCGGSPARYCPDQTVTRGQMAAFLSRAFDLERLAACATQ